MDIWPVIMIALLIVSAIILAITVFMVKRKRKNGQTDNPDYRALFILGICFLPMGVSLSITLENPGFYGIAAMGFIFLLMGIAHRDEWKE